MADEHITVLDLKGLKCPLPVLKARKSMQPMKTGEKIWLETTDPLAVIDVPVFCNENGHRLLATVEAGNQHRFLIERG